MGSSRKQKRYTLLVLPKISDTEFQVGYEILVFDYEHLAMFFFVRTVKKAENKAAQLIKHFERMQLPVEKFFLY